MASFTFSGLDGRYRDSRGRFVSERRIRDVVDNVAAITSDKLGALAQSLRDGNLTLVDWQTQSMAALRDGHLASGIAAIGGRQELSPSQWGYLGSRIKADYIYHRNFAIEISNGKQALDGSLIARSKLYGANSRVTFEASRSREDRKRGFGEERNVLHASAKSCAQCQGLSAQGWVPLGTLPPIGERTCMANCKCSLERRRSVVKAEAA